MPDDGALLSAGNVQNYMNTFDRRSQWNPAGIQPIVDGLRDGSVTRAMVQGMGLSQRYKDHIYEVAGPSQAPAAIRNPTGQARELAELDADENPVRQSPPAGQPPPGNQNIEELLRRMSALENRAQTAEGMLNQFQQNQSDMKTSRAAREREVDSRYQTGRDEFSAYKDTQADEFSKYKDTRAKAVSDQFSTIQDSTNALGEALTQQSNSLTAMGAENDEYRSGREAALDALRSEDTVAREELDSRVTKKASETNNWISNQFNQQGREYERFSNEQANRRQQDLDNLAAYQAQQNEKFADQSGQLSGLDQRMAMNAGVTEAWRSGQAGDLAALDQRQAEQDQATNQRFVDQSGRMDNFGQRFADQSGELSALDQRMAMNAGVTEAWRSGQAGDLAALDQQMAQRAGDENAWRSGIAGDLASLDERENERAAQAKIEYDQRNRLDREAEADKTAKYQAEQANRLDQRFSWVQEEYDQSRREEKAAADLLYNEQESRWRAGQDEDEEWRLNQTSNEAAYRLSQDEAAKAESLRRLAEQEQRDADREERENAARLEREAKEAEQERKNRELYEALQAAKEERRAINDERAIEKIKAATIEQDRLDALKVQAPEEVVSATETTLADALTEDSTTNQSSAQTAVSTGLQADPSIATQAPAQNTQGDQVADAQRDEAARAAQQRTVLNAPNIQMPAVTDFSDFLRFPTMALAERNAANPFQLGNQQDMAYNAALGNAMNQVKLADGTSFVQALQSRLNNSMLNPGSLGMDRGAIQHLLQSAQGQIGAANPYDTRREAILAGPQAALQQRYKEAQENLTSAAGVGNDLGSPAFAEQQRKLAADLMRERMNLESQFGIQAAGADMELPGQRQAALSDALNTQLTNNQGIQTMLGNQINEFGTGLQGLQDQQLAQREATNENIAQLQTSANSLSDSQLQQQQAQMNQIMNLGQLQQNQFNQTRTTMQDQSQVAQSLMQQYYDFLAQQEGAFTDAQGRYDEGLNLGNNAMGGFAQPNVGAALGAMTGLTGDFGNAAQAGAESQQNLLAAVGQMGQGLWNEYGPGAGDGAGAGNAAGGVSAPTLPANQDWSDSGQDWTLGGNQLGGGGQGQFNINAGMGNFMGTGADSLGYTGSGADMNTGNWAYDQFQSGNQGAPNPFSNTGYQGPGGWDESQGQNYFMQNPMQQNPPYRSGAGQSIPTIWAGSQAQGSIQPAINNQYSGGASIQPAINTPNIWAEQEEPWSGVQFY